MVGTVDVQTTIDEIGAVPAIQRPPAEELSLRQRIVPEQRELLGGLTAAGNAPKDDMKAQAPAMSSAILRNGRSGAGDDEGAELIRLPGSKMEADADNLDHLAGNRRLIVRRSLLATAVGGAIPIPVMDDYLAGRVRAGMLMKLAERRQVDLVLSSAELLADPRETTAIRNATMTAATLLALKLAWRKFFAVLAVGRRAEDMAMTFQMGTLFDHFCTKLHVGAGIDRARAFQLRGIIHASVSDAEKSALTAVFREGGRILGGSVLEAPAWMSNRFERAAEQWVRSGGQPPASR